MFNVFLKRILKKRNPFNADNLHLHHLLIKIFSLKQILLFYFFVISISSYLAFNNIASEISIIFFIIFLYFFIYFLIKKKVKKINSQTNE